MKKKNFGRLHSFFYLIGLSLLCLPLLSLSAGGKSSGGPMKFRQAGQNRSLKEAVNYSAFARAAELNAMLREELRWTFGGKAQRGWWLYTALIQHTIGSDKEPDSEVFAIALSRWQKKAGLASDGVLDQETWMKMVSVFQGNRRIGRKRSQSVQHLETVPASSFYDPQRPEELRRVEKQALAAYRRMIEAAAKDLSLSPESSEQWLKIISAYRSPAYQAELRRRSPHSGRAGLAINSPHFTGRALDLYVGGEPVSTKDHNRAIQVKTETYQWLVKNAGRFGFIPYFYEPWHWEYCP